MLPLVGQKLALQDENEGTALTSGCIVAAQVVMEPMAALVGHKADIWGRKPLFLAGLAILSLRGCLYPLSNDRFWLFAVQSGPLWLAFSACCRGSDARHRPFQSGPRSRDYRARHWRGA
jgi:MFS family permease